MRNLLRKMGQKSFRPGSAAAMMMLNATNPQTIKLMRMAMVDVGAAKGIPVQQAIFQNYGSDGAALMKATARKKNASTGLLPMAS